jgi:hypothetical protein
MRNMEVVAFPLGALRPPDGAPFMTTASLSDGYHPTTAGHALYLTSVRSVLGI